METGSATFDESAYDACVQQLAHETPHGLRSSRLPLPQQLAQETQQRLERRGLRDAATFGQVKTCRNSWLQGRRNVIALAPLPQQVAATPLVERTEVPEQTREKEPMRMHKACNLVHRPRSIKMFATCRRD